MGLLARSTPAVNRDANTCGHVAFADARDDFGRYRTPCLGCHLEGPSGRMQPFEHDANFVAAKACDDVRGPDAA